MKTAATILLGVIALDLMKDFLGQTFANGFGCGVLVTALIVFWEDGRKHKEAGK